MTSRLIQPLESALPLDGVRAHLGEVDEVLELGIHEYPFNLECYPAEGSGRKIARSYDVADEYRPAFERFLQGVCEHFGASRPARAGVD